MAVTAIHPGEHPSEELKELGMSAAELARKLGVPTNRITTILHGQRAISGDTALRRAHFFSAPARSSGLICKAFTSCASLRRKPEIDKGASHLKSPRPYSGVNEWSDGHARGRS
jgi:addiction module HigA family antidote